MQLKYFLAASAASLSMAVGLAAPAHAQEVTSGIQGVVVDDNGNPIQGAQVTLTDTRNGRTNTSSTSSQGGFNFRGLEVGGPFTVTVDADGYQGESAEGIVVNLSDTTALRFALASGDSEDVIVVTASSVSQAPLALGPGSSFGLETLEELPSITRDIRDVIQADPRVLLDSTFPDTPTNRGTVSCLGASTRTNSLTVDGVRQDDGFGLNDSGFPSESQPFPFEALSSVSVEFAPFDVQYGLFSGCNINATTKSGTNEFHGGAFIYYNDDSLTGNTVNGQERNLGVFDNLKYGAYVGGPIVKDRLFFHVTYDKEEGSSGLTDGPVGSGAVNEAAGITQQDITEIQNILNTVYGFDAGGVLNSIPRETERFLLRLDANITDDHRVAFNYQRTRENFVTPQNQGARFNDLGLSSNFYQSGNKIDSYSLRLFSNWSDNFSTEVRLSRIENQDKQDSLGGVDFMEFEIGTAGGGTVFLGPDEFRQVNELENQTNQAKVAAYLTAGNHQFTFGAEYDQFDVFNLFVQRGNGVAIFDSIADLAAQDPSRVRITGPVSGNLDDAAAIFKREVFSFYAQDEWLVNPDLTLQFGIRYDMYNSNVNPVANPTFLQRYGFNNRNTFDKLDAFQPRFGFKYDLGDNGLGYTVLRGGVGIFSGGDPTVIFANSYTNNGITLDSVDYRNALDLPAGSIDGFNPPADFQSQLLAGDGEVNAVDPNFKIPTFLRANFGIEHEFAGGWNVLLDYIYSKAYDPLFIQDLTLANVGTAPDGRPLYRQVDFLDPDCRTNPGDTNACDSRFTSDYLLTNGSGGRSHVFSAALRKRWHQDEGPLGIGGNIVLGYSYQDVTSIQPLTSSRAVSNFGNFSKIDVNNPLASRGNASRSHNAIFRLNLEKDLFGDNTSDFTFFLKYRTGQPFSYNFETDDRSGFNPFGDSRDGEDRVLLYVPTTNDPTVVYDPGFDLNAFNSFIADNGLEKYRGQILRRNTFESDDYWDLDFRFTQELPGFFENDGFKFTFDLENVLNLIDSSWNTLQQQGFEYNNPVVQTTINDQGQYVFTNFRTPAMPRISSSASIWQIQFGLSYEF